MESQGKVRAALRPSAFDAVMVGGDFALERCIDRRNFELEGGVTDLVTVLVTVLQRTRFDAVDALIEAIERRRGRTVLGPSDVQN